VNDPSAVLSVGNISQRSTTSRYTCEHILESARTRVQNAASKWGMHSGLMASQFWFIATVFVLSSWYPVCSTRNHTFTVQTTFPITCKVFQEIQLLKKGKKLVTPAYCSQLHYLQLPSWEHLTVTFLWRAPAKHPPQQTRWQEEIAHSTVLYCKVPTRYCRMCTNQKVIETMQCSPSSRNVWHKVLHSKTILELLVCALW
jgi:hypothetical protein